MTNAKSYRAKRVFDLVVVALGAPVAIVVVALAATAIKVTSRGPVFFRQTHVGRDGAEFELIKLRTMVDLADNPLFPDDDRITTVGRLLRRASLDEVPQLVNVVRGEMSVVGPRPTLPYQVARYDDRQRQRLLVRPGLTGLAQVNGRNAATWDERIAYDLTYIAEQSLFVDLRILARTIGAVLGGSGVEGHPADDPIARPPETP